MRVVFLSGKLTERLVTESRNFHVDNS